MIKPAAFFIAILLGAMSAVVCFTAPAQAQTHPNVINAPNYSSGVSAGPMTDSNFNTPESDGRPGVKFFTLGVLAFKKGDYRHAIDMYKVAASWADKPAEYNLGLMYFRGNGVPVNRPLGAAWMVLAAERGTPLYVKARDVMVTLETKAQFAETDRLWGKLRKTYSDKVALPRAKAQWAFVKTHETGSRVGGAVGELHVGSYDLGDHSTAANNNLLWGGMYTQSGSSDGSLTYRQFQESSNPYSPIFLNRRTGTATVEPLQQIEPKSSAKPSKAQSGSANEKGGSSAPATPSTSGRT